MRCADADPSACLAPALAALLQRWPLPAPLRRIALYAIDLGRAGCAAQAQALPLLSAAERGRHAGYRRMQDAHRYAIARAALRGLLAQRCGASPQALPLIDGPYGRPGLAPGVAPGLDFNLSHAGPWVFIALAMDDEGQAGLRVGVDVEALQPRPAAEFAALAGALCGAEELARHPGPWSVARFYALWTAKEALAKAWGWGLGGPLHRLAVHDVLAPCPQLRWAGAALPPAQGRLWRLPAPPGYALALALAEAPPPNRAGAA